MVFRRKNKVWNNECTSYETVPLSQLLFEYRGESKQYETGKTKPSKKAKKTTRTESRRPKLFIVFIFVNYFQ